MQTSVEIAAVAVPVAVLVALVVAWARCSRRVRDLLVERAASARRMERVEEALAASETERDRLGEEARRANVLAHVDEQRAALLRAVSHDLRTPLATIRAATSDLRSGPDFDPAARDELLDLVADEAERLDRLVANLLNLSRIEAGAFRPDRQAVDLDELVVERTRKLSRLFRDTRLELGVPGDLPLVDGDYAQLDQVISNLLENAARHAPQRSTVRVSARRRDDCVEVRVSDSGMGVAGFNQERIFQPFHRGERTRHGIGLSVCKGVVEAHGGRIWVEASPGGGATFAFTVPLHRGVDEDGVRA